MIVTVETFTEARQVVLAAIDFLKSAGKGHCLVSCNCSACFARKALEEAGPDLLMRATQEERVNGD